MGKRWVSNYLDPETQLDVSIFYCQFYYLKIFNSRAYPPKFENTFETAKKNSIISFSNLAAFLDVKIRKKGSMAFSFPNIIQLSKNGY